MKIVIVGDGKVGHALSEQLSGERHDIVVIDNKPDRARYTDTRLDVVAVQGNGASYLVQQEAGVAEADLLIAATSADEVNMLCCLVAKKMGAKGTIARVRNPEYTQQLELMGDDLGLSMTINPELAAAAEIARILAFPSATRIETFGRGRVELYEFVLPDTTPLHGLALAGLYSTHKLKVLICVVQRAGQVFIPSGDFVLQRGDVLNITSTRTRIQDFCRVAGITTHKIHNVMVAGGSRIAYYLTRQLQHMGLQVKIVERDRARCLQLCERFPEAMIIEGDAGDYTLLQEEGLADTDAFVSLTGNDEENILMSLNAATQGVHKVVTKVNRDGLTGLAGKLKLGSVISPKYITANNIVQVVRALANSQGSNVETLHRLVDNTVEALEFRIVPGFARAGVPLKELQFQPNLLLACILRGSEVIIPGGNDTIEVGDSVVVVTTRRFMDDIADIFADSAE